MAESTGGGGSLRSRSVRRAVQPRYDKAEEQVGRIMRAAVELIRDSESLDLRVTDVITAAGVSNRAFYLLMQVKGGEFVRVHPRKIGTFDCDPRNATTLKLDLIR